MEEDTAMIPYFVHEGEMSRMERANKRMWVLVLVLVLMLVGTNVGWLVYESQFEDLVVTQEVDTGEGAALVSGTGDVIYGSNSAESEDQGEENKLGESNESMP